MPIIDFKKLLKSFKYAIHGIVIAVKKEQNFRIHLIATLVVIAMIFYFKVSVMEAVVLVLVIALVLVLELINTIFERIIDILKPRLHPYVESIKDMMAATVLLSSIGALIIGLIIFIPKIINKFF